jgi:hypothetical protein
LGRGNDLADTTSPTQRYAAIKPEQFITVQFSCTTHFCIFIYSIFFVLYAQSSVAALLQMGHDCYAGGLLETQQIGNSTNTKGIEDFGLCVTSFRSSSVGWGELLGHFVPHCVQCAFGSAFVCMLFIVVFACYLLLCLFVQSGERPKFCNSLDCTDDGGIKGKRVMN